MSIARSLSLSLYIYIYIHVYVKYIYIYIYIYILSCNHIYIYTYIHTYIYTAGGHKFGLVALKGEMQNPIPLESYQVCFSHGIWRIGFLSSV